jgi:hypothetical protein
MDKGLGDAAFLDAAVGDAWATDDPDTAATDRDQAQWDRAAADRA